MTDILAQEPMPATPTASKSFGQIVRRAFFRRFLHWTATIYVCVLTFIAVFVPFIANGRPFRATVEGVQRYPLFKSMTRMDWILLVGAAGFAVHLLVRALSRRMEPDGRAQTRRRSLVAVLVVAALSSGAIGLFKKNYNDLLHREDYRQLTPDYEVRNAVFPLVSWGFEDGEYPFKVSSQYQPPSAAHLLGTDGTGRDTLARLLWSTRVVFGISLISQVVALAIGVTLGALMGYFGGTVDILGNRFMEIVESVPTFFLIITLVAVLGRQISIIMLVLGLVGWTGIARFVRADFLKLRNTDFVQAAVAGGIPLRSILFRHILPNALTPVLVNATFGIAGVVTLESSLSFLGVGVEPPTASWGSMLQEAGNPGAVFHFWMALFPGVMIFLTVFAYNIIGEGLRDAIDPRTNKME
jgi:peptide/nickel transport system permease protein